MLGETLAQDGQQEAAIKSLEMAVQLSAPGDNRARKLLEKVQGK